MSQERPPGREASETALCDVAAVQLSASGSMGQGQQQGGAGKVQKGADSDVKTAADTAAAGGGGGGVTGMLIRARGGTLLKAG